MKVKVIDDVDISDSLGGGSFFGAGVALDTPIVALKIKWKV